MIQSQGSLLRCPWCDEEQDHNVEDYVVFTAPCGQESMNEDQCDHCHEWVRVTKVEPNKYEIERAAIQV